MSMKNIFSGTLLIFKKKKAKIVPEKIHFASASVSTCPFKNGGRKRKSHYDSEISLNHSSLEQCLEDDCIKPDILSMTLRHKYF